MGMSETLDIAKQGNRQATSQDEQLPRKRGRPPGQPKTGGRKRGTKNWTNSEIRSELLGRSGAIHVLADIVAGRQLYAGQSGSVGKAGWRYPTLQQRLQALQILLAKVVPDLKAQELTGAEGEPLIPDPPGPVDTRQLARVVLKLLSDANMVDSLKFKKSDIG
jgi:hypothetical protein